MSERTIEQRLTAIEVALQLVLSPEHRALINSKDLKGQLREAIDEVRREDQRDQYALAQGQGDALARMMREARTKVIY